MIVVFSKRYEVSARGRAVNKERVDGGLGLGKDGSEDNGEGVTVFEVRVKVLDATFVPEGLETVVDPPE